MEQPEPNRGGIEVTCWQCGSRKGPAKPGEAERSTFLAKRYASVAIVCRVCASILEYERKPPADASKRYVTTVWTRTYDFDGLVEDFAVLRDQTELLSEAVYQLLGSVRQLVDDDLKQHPKWTRLAFDDNKRGFCYINRRNSVVARDWDKIGDSSAYNSRYYYFEIIEVPAGRPVDEALFTPGDKCPWEVKYFFEEQQRKVKVVREFNEAQLKPEPPKPQVNLYLFDPKKESVEQYVARVNQGLLKRQQEAARKETEGLSLEDLLKLYGIPT